MARVERFSVFDTTMQRLVDVLDERASTVVVLDGPPGAWAGVDVDQIRSIAAVTIGVVFGGDREPPLAAAACDVCASVGGVRSGNWQWVGNASELADWIQLISTRIERSPLAATVLARTLRLTESLSVSDGLVVESFAYSVLQAAPEHQRWLANPTSWKKPVG